MATATPTRPPPSAGALAAMRPARGARVADRVATGFMLLAFMACLLPLVAVLWLVVKNGAARFDSTFFTHSMRNVAAQDEGGGAYHAIIGTIEQVAIASMLAVPLGLLVAVFLVEVGAGGGFAKAVRYVVDVMTGLPSIVAGLFVLSFWVLALHRGFSGFAGAISLAILMLPVVVRSAEEMLRLVPHELREAGLALGLARWRIVLRIVLPTALPGIVTGIMLAVARITGETAPLLLTVFGTDSINFNPFNGPQSALPLFVFDQAGRPNQPAIDRAWAGALTLILIVVVLNLVARLLSRRNRLTH